MKQKTVNEIVKAVVIGMGELGIKRTSELEINLALVSISGERICKALKQLKGVL